MTDPFLPPPSDPPDPDFRETRHGGHALILEHTPGHAIVIEYGDCEFWVSCQCGFGLSTSIRPDRPLDRAVRRVVDHAPEQRMTLTPHCQCSAGLGAPFPAFPTAAHLARPLDSWERHSMGGAG